MHKEIILQSRILIVDDQQANSALLERLLGQAGYSQFTSLNDPRQVIEQFRSFQPDLIVLDLMMPHVDGFAVMTQLRGWVSDETYLPILVVTADVSKAAKQKALSLGAKDFLTKPIENTEAMLRVYNLLETRWLYRQIQTKNKFLIEQVRESRQQLAAARSEVDRLSSGSISPDQLAHVSKRIVQAVTSIERIGETAETFYPGQFLELPAAEAEEWAARGWTNPVL